MNQTTHDRPLLIEESEFIALRNRQQTAVIREVFDQSFEVGQTLVLQEVDARRQPTGWSGQASITHIQKERGLYPGYAMLSLNVLVHSFQRSEKP